jgi:hypothetical protein
MADELDPLDVQERERLEKDRQDRENRNRLQEVEDNKWLASDKRGRRILWRLLEKTGVFRDPFTGEALTTANQCGKKAIGLDYLNQLQFMPGRFEQMIAENSEHDNQPADKSRS